MNDKDLIEALEQAKEQAKMNFNIPLQYLLGMTIERLKVIGDV
jgi:hypothetical protein